MPDPRDPAFWSDEERRFWDAIAPTLVSVTFAGGMSGYYSLPESLRHLVNWDLYNQAAIDYLHAYHLNTVAKITETTRRQAVGAIDAWLRTGEALPVLEAQLIGIFGRNRAGMIATTEVTRLYAAGNQLAWKASQVVSANRWNTAADERVCPYCGPLEGIVAALGEAFTPGITAPPYHVRCRCWLTPVVSEGLLREQLRQAFGKIGDVDTLFANLRQSGAVELAP